jgi:hypothetical protein
MVNPKNIKLNSKSFYDRNNFFLIKIFLKVYKNEYLKLFHFKKNSKFKIYKRLKNKVFARKLF